MHIKYELTIAEKNIGVKVKSEDIFEGECYFLYAKWL